MTTRAIVPNGDGEGSLGTASAKWGAVYSSDPASGENSGQVPTTAWVQNLLADALAKQKTAYEQAISTAVTAAKTQAKLDAHPVGSIYTSLTDSRNPNAILGFGTWEALPAGYTLIAQGSGTDDYGSFTYTAGQKYGERKHPLTTDELAPHMHQEKMTTKDGNPNPLVNLETSGTLSGATVPQRFEYSNTATDTVNTVSAGEGKGHNNIPPVIASYIWSRTA